ncbi:MAG: MAPEG family protein [Gemmobacter sp.]|uniref:MAPEG family protein n=1 Tax=Gemmobacter sp. TaxID=1898957 RepID=UPI00391ADEBF
MTPELAALELAALLQMVQFVLFAVPANLELGPDYTAGPRDTPPKRALSPRTARLQRALNNHFEGLILFGIAATVVTVSGQSSPLTAACAWAYLGARLLYIPAYAFGWAPWRSVIWAVGWFATLVMLLASLL